VVATLVRLKLRILRHTLRREPWRLVLLVLGGLWGLSLMPGLVGGMLWLGHQSARAVGEALAFAGGVLLLGWVTVPVLVPGMDDSLEPARFATTGVRARRIAPGLFVAGTISLPSAITALVVASPVVAWAPHGVGPVLVALACAVPAHATCLLTARLATGVAARLLGSRHSREVAALLGVVVLIVAVVALIAVGRLGIEGLLERVPGVAAVLSWTPAGAWFAAPALVAQEQPLAALARLVVALAAVAAGFAGWVHLLGRALTDPPSRGNQRRRRVDALVPRRPLLHRPGLVAAAAIARRGLRSWTADPRYLSALLGALLTPLVIVAVGSALSSTPDGVALSMGMLVGGALGWGRHNDVAYDGSAFWLHVAARTPGWADRLGRTAATLVWALPATVAIALGGVAFSGRRELAPAAVGAAVGVLLCGLAVSAVVSAMLPYPVPEAGGNPYAAQMGAVGATLVAQVVASAVTVVACAPVVVLYAGSLWWRAGLAPATLAVGVVWGAAMLALGVVLGGRVYDGRSSRLLARLA
jgi:ABC-2 type transport system permease protein